MTLYIVLLYIYSEIEMNLFAYCVIVKIYFPGYIYKCIILYALYCKSVIYLYYINKGKKFIEKSIK